MDLNKLSAEDWMLGGGGILLVIGLLAFPWLSFSLLGASYTAVATDAPDGFWAVLALLVMIAVVADLALVRFSPATAIPTTKLGRDRTRLAGVGLAALFMFIKFVSHTGNLGWGFFVNVILLIVVAVGAWRITEGRSTPVGSR
ncbi:MAG TPA: hypothetical protein VID68_02640 [Solirubrobacteraceae bacterium]